MSKKIMIVLVVLAAGVFLTGCTWFGGGEEEVDENSGGELENVEVVDDGNDEENVEEVEEDTDTVEEDEDTVEDEEVDEEVEEEDTEEEAVVDEEGAQSVGVGTSADGAVINAYSYEVSGGRLNFEWKVSANGDVYPQASAARASNNSIIVTFPSLQRDSVAKEEKTSELGSRLPDLKWMPDGDGSKYEFMYETEKDFDLKTVDRGEEGRFIVISIDF